MIEAVMLCQHGVLDRVDALAVHGFPLDRNLRQIGEWPQMLTQIRALTDLPVWVSEVGVSGFGADEVLTCGHLGLAAHHSSAPREPERYAEFREQMVRRYAPHVSAEIAAEHAS